MFFGTLDGNYTSFDAGDGGSEARGINNAGYIVGYSNSQNGTTADQPIFERKPGGKLVTIPGVFGRAQGIDNAKNRFAGTRWDFGSHEAVAFLGHRGAYKHEYHPGSLREKLFGGGHARLAPPHPGARFRSP